MTKAEAVLTIWDYMLLQHGLQKADVILLLGSNDPRTAKYAAELFLEGWAPYLVITGDGTNHVNKNRALPDVFGNRPEAEVFAAIAMKAGVPKEKLILETKANNTAENFTFTKQLLGQRGIAVDTAIVVQKPYMERRSFATGKIAWPELEQIVTSPDMSYQEYISGDIAEDHIINSMVGDLQRIKIYPEKGFQLKQEIPTEVDEAFAYLQSLGYTKRLIK